jgi:hypothetical protein
LYFFFNLEKSLDESQADALSYLSNQSVNPRSEKLNSHQVEKVNMQPNSWIKLRCNATGSTQSNKNGQKVNSYDLHWYKDGKLIEQDSRRLKKWVSSYDNANYMELELYAVDNDDSGVYQCKRDKQILKDVILNVLDNSSSSNNKFSHHLNSICMINFLIYLILNFV